MKIENEKWKAAERYLGNDTPILPFVCEIPIRITLGQGDSNHTWTNGCSAMPPRKGELVRRKAPEQDS
jgi:hypothetical protein